MQTFFIDTFTGTNCKGNPTVVCLVEEPCENEQCLKLAKQFNVPVTAFVDIVTRQSVLFSIRYFTAAKQIPACGHATLAAAKVLFDLLGKDDISFITVEQIKINARQQEEAILMKYPAYSLSPVNVSTQLLESLQVKEIATASFCAELETLFIELGSAAELRSVKPLYQQLMNSSDTIKEVVLTSVSDDDRFDYMLRSFCPWIGIDEDPVTGSVHSVLAGYWSKRFNKTKLYACQASVEGGEIIVEAGDGFVWIGGRTSLSHAEQAQ
ncbi:PhzF family phenazine biosynthesis protein [Lacibacter sediminis]|uniref:PhzF family phenazine biosynthesis isomerase n=1 Tax=Lacibacter sediminis TaxID=2760713 RepID=A0A7G5XF88_9BACT|nr:PhzF family phenazine biosynthesis isomerase [Lacibacter sediminis]QNA44141.1 PhzF family phenazine biosynthesis isomerase [Lacibacter sediminis]